ncbi:MAG: DUF3572 family protein [Allosphingosinicella sp.]|uniref:DUF3572 family protein n=1 Tax=Allosphingosinicella sp. TaxID=2823234 RepID=UPI003957034A
MRNETNKASSDTVALSALAWILSDESRAQRLLATTGLTPDQLRDGLGDAAVLAAGIRFLEAWEPDLVACASDLGASPSDLVEARRQLENG